MEPKFQTSFIPKRPVIDASRAALPTVKNFNIFSLFATVVFTITILVSAGLFGYRLYIINEIVKADKTLDEARSIFEPDTVKDLLDASTRFRTINNLLENHFVVSELLLVLKDLTVKNVAFSDLAYRYNNKIISLDIKGVSRSYNAIAQQSDIFAESDFFQNQVFSGFSLTENGNIGFKYSANILKDKVSYKSAVNRISSDIET